MQAFPFTLRCDRVSRAGIYIAMTLVAIGSSLITECLVRECSFLSLGAAIVALASAYYCLTVVNEMTLALTRSCYELAVRLCNVRHAARQRVVENVHFASDSLAQPNACAVCLENRITTLYLPCRHACTCTECGRKCEHCPLCRGVIEQIEPVFLS